MLQAIFFSRAGLVGLAFAGVLIFYEGIPILGDIPFLQSIPVVGPVLEAVAVGRVDEARQDGAAQERIAWEEARRKLLAQLDQARRDAQAVVDAAEREYLARRTEDTLRISQLEQAIVEMEADETNPACPDRPAFSRGVSKSLDAIGR